MASVNLSASIAAIHADIKAFRVDIKAELTAFRDSFTKDVKEELSSFKQDVNQKLNGLVTDLNVTAERIDEAERRVAELEEGAAESREMLCQSIQMQEHLQERLLDLETRSRRNNIQIFGIPEGSEGNNVKDLVESIIKTELSLSDLDLKIQRCHRALGPKPPADAYPRSVVVFFLEYRTKDLVLRSAWMKKEVNGKRIFFDQDYPPEIQQNRKTFAPIRKILKEKGIKFQTPPTAKLKVFLEN
ncbi:LINE-1 type transposase domain-containing 1 [Labeo rohita]|uniref:LINE-1 type transposase domain-containing 1 n=1 Tax=Labeo rohita TaxID=84645 RepID=A0A498P468_LABRO|nr:LINE-1 type transposase domain-containing 1 [Labeo rohita]